MKGLTAHGTLADIALWLIFRMESHILASKKYESVMRVVRRRQTKSALQAKNKVQEEVRKQGNAALEHFRLRRERAQRIDRLKVINMIRGGLEDLNFRTTLKQSIKSLSNCIVSLGHVYLNHFLLELGHCNSAFEYRNGHVLTSLNRNFYKSLSKLFRKLTYFQQNWRFQ